MKTDYECLKPQVEELVKTIQEGLDAFAVIGDSKTILAFTKMVKWFWKNHSPPNLCGTVGHACLDLDAVFTCNLPKGHEGPHMVKRDVVLRDT